MVIFFNCIPLIDRYDNTFAPLMCNTGDLGILLCDTFGRIDHNHAHICPLHRRHGTDDAVSLNLSFNLILAAQSGGINKHVLPVLIADIGIYGIACGSCNIRDNHALLICKPVDQRRFPHIRLPYNGHLRAPVLFFLTAIFRKMADNLVKHLPDSEPRSRRNRNRIPDSKIVKLIDIGHVFFKTVNFINHKCNWFSGTTKHVSNLGISILQPLSYICQKYNHICSRDCNLCLLPHL